MAPFCSSGSFYTVQSGDGCWAIANANAGATSKGGRERRVLVIYEAGEIYCFPSSSFIADQLYAANPGLGGACLLAIGESLCLPNSVKTTTTTTPTITTTTSTSTTSTIHSPIANVNCTATYTVVGGDSCWNILYLKLHSFISQDNFYSWNGGSDAFCSSLSVGQELCVGPVAPFCASGQYHTVQSGEGCYSIGNEDDASSSKRIKRCLFLFYYYECLTCI